MRTAALALLAMAGAALAPEEALAADPPPTGLELGWRTGLALPMGDALGTPSGQKGLPLGDVVTVALPVWIDAGYRLGPHVFVGADFEYARALVSPRQGCPVPGMNCSASEVLAGAQLHYHPAPARAFDPWAGVAVGYEILNVSTSASGGSFDGGLAALQAGADYKPTPAVSIGPFVMLAVGPFLGCARSSGAPCSVSSVGAHEWLTIGVRAAYDIPLGG